MNANRDHLSGTATACSGPAVLTRARLDTVTESLERRVLVPVATHRGMRSQMENPVSSQLCQEH